MMKAYEIPTKQQVDRSILDAAVTKAVETGSFTIEITDEGKSTSIQFKRFLHPIERAVYLNQVADRALVHDSDNGCLMVDECGLALTTHAFILSFLSTMPELSVEREDGDTLGDAVALGNYGSFFTTISNEYTEVFRALWDDAVSYCQVKINNHNEMMKASYKNMDMSSFATNPEVLEIFKSIVLQQRENDSQQVISSNKDAVLPFPKAGK